MVEPMDLIWQCAVAAFVTSVPVSNSGVGIDPDSGKRIRKLGEMLITLHTPAEVAGGPESNRRSGLE